MRCSRQGSSDAAEIAAHGFGQGGIWIEEIAPPHADGDGSQKSILVTGASSGSGRHLTQTLAAAMEQCLKPPLKNRPLVVLILAGSDPG